MSRGIALAVLGDPLAFTRSPELHRAGLAALGLDGDSRAIRTAPDALGARLDALALEGLTGVNLTHPLKEPALAYLDRVSPAARLARSVNTVGFGVDGRWGDTTDGAGFVDWLARLGRDPVRGGLMLFGGGGAARSIALAMIGAGCTRVVVAVRDPARAAESWSGIPQAQIARSDDARVEAMLNSEGAVMVNATPITDAAGPVAVERVRAGSLVLDLVYGATIGAWTSAARARGLTADDGLGLLVFQARRSLALWTGREVPIEPLARAVGWPR